MQQNTRKSVGVPASPSGYSAEPEPSFTVSAVPVSIPNAAWSPMSDAPRDGSVIFGRTFDGLTLLAHWEGGGFLNEDEQDVGSWVAEYEDEHPEDWTDGACWASNENEVPSDPLVAFISLAAIASDAAEACVYQPGTANYTRVYQGAYNAAKRSFRTIASAIEARRAETAQTGSVGDESAGPKDDAQTTSQDPSGILTEDSNATD